jgi:hypothetical protein
MSNKATGGIIKESWHFALDGEYSSGYNEYNVEVVDYWKSGDLKGLAREVKTPGGAVYRMTTKNGWREYYKDAPPGRKYKNNGYTGTSLNFVPNEKADSSKNVNRVNLGSW